MSINTPILPRRLYRVTAVLIIILLFALASRNIPYVAAQATTVIVSPDDMNDWYFFQERYGLTYPFPGTGNFVTGPTPAPHGSGSAHLTLSNSNLAEGIGILMLPGTRFDALTTLTYAAYRTSGSSDALGMTLQFNIDENLNDANTNWQGRLVYEPYWSGTNPSTGTWQTWNALAPSARWWRTSLSANAICGRNNPCSRATLLATYPNIGIHPNVNSGAVLFKIGSGWPSFDGNIDNFVLGVNGVNTTYDFETGLPVHNITRNTHHATIQAGIAGATTGDVIEIDPGTYAENVVVDKPLTLRGAGAGSNPTSDTILEGTSRPGKGISLNNNVTDVLIEDMRIQNYTGTPQSSGIYGSLSNHNFTARNVAVNGNGPGSVSASGGIVLNGPINNVTIDQVTAENNWGRGIVIWNGLKTNITITNNTVRNNNCCGIELQDGTASGVTITGNTVQNNADSGMSAIGLTSGTGPNVIAGNVVTNNGRFGIEIKNPNGSGLDSGDGSIVVENNTVSFTPSASMDRRDLAGIAVFRRDFQPNNPTGYVDVPTGVVIRNNTLSGYRQERTVPLPPGQTTLTSEGFGIVIEGTGHTVSNNTVENNNIGIQEQGGLHPYANYVYNNSGSGDQENEKSPQYFGRGNAPVACGNTITPNTLTGNGTATRQRVINGSGGFVTNTDTSKTFCTIQAAINDTDTDAGDTIQLEAASYTELVDITKSIILQGQVGTIIYPSQNIPDFTSSHSGSILWIQATNVVIRNLEINGDNPAISGGYAYGSADINAVRGIYMNGTFFDNSRIENVTLQNLGRGINLYGGQNHTIQNNTAQNLGGLDNGNYGYGILMMGNSSAEITGNQVDGALTAGIFMQNNSSANNTRIVTNTVSNAGIGLGWNMLYGGANGLFENNTVTNVELGMQVTSITNGYLEIRNNTFTMPSGNGEQGFYVWNTAPDRVLITGNTLSGGDEGVALVNNSIDFGFGQAHLRLTNNTIQNTGTAVTVTSQSNAHTISLVATGNTIQNATTGVNLGGTESINSATIAGNTFDTVDAAFDAATTGPLFAYANNITNFTTGVNNTSGALNARHNWWGAITPAGVNDTNAYDYRLGAAVNTWGEGALGSASLTSAGGSGTGIIVSHGRGLANVPFGKGNDPYASAMCSDYYDFFVLNAVGDWTVSVPVDAGAACDTALANNALFKFTLSGTMPDTACVGGACWEPPTGVSANGRSLQVTLDAPTYLQGTPFAAGDNSPLSSDPTAVSLSTFSASANNMGMVTAVTLLLFTLTGLVLWKRRID